MVYSNEQHNRLARHRRTDESGFTLIEILVVITIIGILVAIAIPTYQRFVVRAKVTEGLHMLAAQKTHIATFYSTEGRLPKNFEELGFTAASGKKYSGDSGSFKSVFGYGSDMWKSVEYQPKSGGYVLVLRSYKKPQWGNADLGLHFQIKADEGGVRFRCTVNNEAERQPYVPATCRQGSVDDWSW